MATICICSARFGEEHFTLCPAAKFGRRPPRPWEIERDRTILAESTPERDYSHALVVIDVLEKKREESRQLMRRLRMQLALRHNPSAGVTSTKAPREEGTTGTTATDMPKVAKDAPRCLP